MTSGFLADGLEIVAIRTPGLGDTTYVVGYDGLGLLVDPQRDIDRFLQQMADRDLDPRWVMETHLHNDYVSGAVVAADRSGAELVLPAAAAPIYRHTPAFHNEEIGSAGLRIRPIHTPGHTPEHTSYLLIVEDEPVALFSGGSLLVGSAGRPDLLGFERADSLARLQYHSVNRLAELPDDVGLYPTHGEGSFCTVSGAGETTSTVGAERRSNPVLAYADADAFVAGQLGVLEPYPSYYRHMGSANLVGGKPMPTVDLPVLDPGDVAARSADSEIVDVRDRARFAAGHVPGSLGVELANDFGVWVGWLVDIDRPLVLVADADQDIEEARVQLARIGYDNVIGVMYGIDAWQSSGRPLAAHETIDVAGFVDRMERGLAVLDVRSPGERGDLHLEASDHVYVPDIPEHRFESLKAGDEVLIVCGTGYRANIAAGLLERKGLRPVPLSRGGVSDVARHREPASAVGVSG